MFVDFTCKQWRDTISAMNDLKRIEWSAFANSIFHSLWLIVLPKPINPVHAPLLVVASCTLQWPYAFRSSHYFPIGVKKILGVL